MKTNEAISLPGVAKDLKLRIAELRKEIEKTQGTIRDLKNFPMIHHDLQERIQALSRVLYYLERRFALAWQQKSHESRIQALSVDFGDLVDRRK